MIVDDAAPRASVRMDWTGAIADPAELRSAFAGNPENRWRPIPAWWWSGEKLDEERLRWQLDRLVEMGCGGVATASLAAFGPAGGSVGDDPPVGTPERTALYRRILLRCRELGLGVVTGSPYQAGGMRDMSALLREHPDFRGEMTAPGPTVLPYGFDFGNVRAVATLARDGAVNRMLAESTGDLDGDPVVALFEDEMWCFGTGAPGFAEEFRAVKGFDPPAVPFAPSDDPRMPALRWQVCDVARQRIERAYTEPYARMVRERGLLAGYDQMSRMGTPIIGALAYVDHFRTMAWANAPGSDQMGDIRFHLSLATLTGASRVWLEGFHSQGQGLSLAHQAEALFEWAREGASLFLPHGGYYATRGMWWEWASPEMLWRQPFSRHYAPFAEAMARVMMAAAAGRHHPEVAVLHPLSTVWADTLGHMEWGESAQRANQVYVQLMGHHGSVRWDRPDEWATRSLLHDAGHDRMAVNEDWLDRVPDLPVVLPACRCLPLEVVDALIARAERGVPVVIVEPLPDWSAENGAGDAEFLTHVARLRSLATVVATPAEVPAALPPPRAAGAEVRVQWRRCGDLDLLLCTGEGELRVRGVGPRSAERWEFRDGSVHPLDARLDGDDLLLRLDGPFTIVALPPGEPQHVATPAPSQEIPLPVEWECRYLEWGENRWGDLRLPPNPGTPPVERRTFAWREGDDPAWRSAPVVPEDVEHPMRSLGMEERMSGDNGRVPPRERMLRDGWREVVSTYGPRATVDGVPFEYSERYGIEDVCLETLFGVRGKVETWKAVLPEDGGRLVSYGHVPQACDTHLVIEGDAVITVWLDGTHLAGPLDNGVLAIPVHLDAGWHEVAVEVVPRHAPHLAYRGYSKPPPTALSWCFGEPYRRAPVGIWGGRMVHPDYRGAPQARRFRRRITLSEPAEVEVSSSAAATHHVEVPPHLEAGEHVVEAFAGETMTTPSFGCSLRLRLRSGAVLEIGSDERWETCAAGEPWVGAYGLSAGSPLSGWGAREQIERRHTLTDVAWLEGEEVVRGLVPQRWSDSPEPPPPSWFCFLAPPGARSMTLPVDGEVQAWLDGEEVRIDDGVLPLRGGARVAIRVQAHAGGRGAACFREHPVLTLGDGVIRTGISWHRQGLDSFAGVILHRATVRVERDMDAVLDLGEVRGSAGVRVNGEDLGALWCRPWRIEVPLRAGENLIELEVTNTLAPLVARGVPTIYGPEDQRVSGLLGRPRLLRYDH